MSRQFTTEYLANEDSVIMEYLTNGGSKEQSVDGSITPIVFSSTPVPANKIFLVARIMIYMEDSSNFSSTIFGGLASALANGWQMAWNGTPVANVVDNKGLAVFMFDLTGDKLFGKDNQTMVGRFSFDKIVDGARGVSIEEGNVLSTIVNDDLTGLDFLNVMVQGILIDS